ncbi:MAG: hypothetical protein WEC75_06300 [Dehalococcoidia bacterium]
MLSSIQFALCPHLGDATLLEVIPVVDGVRLTDRVHQFELDQGMETCPVSYGGLIPRFHKVGRAKEYYFGVGKAPLSENGKIPLLGCECGEWGCWPFLARVVVAGTTVAWTDFEQPFEIRDYSEFGLFTFGRADYETAIATIADAWDRR